jgi:hypothetical protein
VGKILTAECHNWTGSLINGILRGSNIKIDFYSIIILSLVLYGYESWSLILRDECRLRVFVNRVLRKIFGSKRDKVTGECRKLHNEKLYDLYSSPNIVRVIKSRGMRWAGHLERLGERRGIYGVLVGRPEGKNH